MAPIHTIVHQPTSMSGKASLAIRVANVHAEYVLQRLKKINCPVNQKNALLDAIKRHLEEPK